MKIANFAPTITKIVMSQVEKTHISGQKQIQTDGKNLSS